MDRVAQAAVAMVQVETVTFDRALLAVSTQRGNAVGFTYFGHTRSVRQTNGIVLDFQALYPSLMARPTLQDSTLYQPILDAYARQAIAYASSMDQMPPLEEVE